MLEFQSSAISGEEIQNLNDLLQSPFKFRQHWYSRQCEEFLADSYPNSRLYFIDSIFNSALATLILMELKEGDEVIIPAFSPEWLLSAIKCVSATAVLADIEPQTLNICVKNLSAKITAKTKAVFITYFIGMTTDLDEILYTAARNDLALIEICSTGLGATYKNKALGSLGNYGIIGFESLASTNLLNGCVWIINNDSPKTLDKIAQLSNGISNCITEPNAALLLARLNIFNASQERLTLLWNYYHNMLKTLEEEKHLRILKTLSQNIHNSSNFAVILPNADTCQALKKHLFENQIDSQIIQTELNYLESNLPNATQFKDCVLCLPIHANLAEEDILRVSLAINEFFGDDSSLEEFAEIKKALLDD